MGAAKGLFFHADASRDTLNKRVRPSDEQLTFLREKKELLENHLTQDLRARAGCLISTWIQGSYKFRTLIRPVHKTASYDVDVGVYFEWGTEEGALLTPREIRNHLQASLLAFKAVERDIVEVVDPAKERCSRTTYKQQFQIDTPGYHHHTDTGVARLATLSGTWEFSDPEKMVGWFQGRLDGDDRAQVRRLIRYMKAWAALRFETDKKALPSSLMLTVLVVESYEQALEGRALDDDDALAEIVSSIFWRLCANRAVNNPVDSDQDRDINRMDTQAFESFMTGLRELDDVARRAADCEEEADAAAVWSEAFDYLLPLPDVEGLAEENLMKGMVVLAPEIQVDISGTEGGPVVRRYKGEVDFVRRDEWLRFRILNPDVLPPQATVRWVVRNVGDDAYRANDLGHSARDLGELVHDERAAYHGRHFMDCEVRVGGRLRSITRVPVVVSPVANVPRHVPRPAYTRLRARR